MELLTLLEYKRREPLLYYFQHEMREDRACFRYDLGSYSSIRQHLGQPAHLALNTDQISIMVGRKESDERLTIPFIWDLLSPGAVHIACCKPRRQGHIHNKSPASLQICIFKEGNLN